MNKKIVAISFFSMLQFLACKEVTNSTENQQPSVDIVNTVQAPNFDASNAYQLIEKQVSFGPRVPGTKAQINCAAWIEQEIKKYVDTVYVQKTTVTQPVSNKKYPCINVIGSINPTASERILLLAHWDSRPWADNDIQNQSSPIDAADDGASGVAVMLEIAAKLKTQKPSIGIDFLFVDAEDVGKSEWEDENNKISSYSLGTYYWAKNPHVPNYKANFGICLDMVGAKGAQFPLEAYSKMHAYETQQKIWAVGNQLGYTSYFVNTDAGGITDDHIPVNEILKIPTVDIINLQPGGSFGNHWHTHNDNIAIIEKNTLKAVGQTVLQVIYNEDKKYYF